MSTASERMREQLVHDLEILRKKRAAIPQPRGWRPTLRQIGLVVFLVSVFATASGSNIARGFALTGFIVGAVLMAVPREVTFAGVLYRLGWNDHPPPAVERAELDGQIAALERALARVDRQQEP